MKKISLVFVRILFIIVVSFFTIGLTGCSLGEVSLLYRESYESDGLFICVNRIANCCFVGSYECEGYPDNMEIIIPDEFDGVPIERIGGYYGRGVPTPFGITLYEVMNAPKGSEYDFVGFGSRNEFETEECAVEDVIFNLHIGKNIKVVEDVDLNEYYPHINDDGSITYYHPVVNITCSEDNEKFYSKDGKLYYKSSDKLVEKFEYAE